MKPDYEIVRGIDQWPLRSLSVLSPNVLWRLLTGVRWLFSHVSQCIIENPHKWTSSACHEPAALLYIRCPAGNKLHIILFGVTMMESQQSPGNPGKWATGCRKKHLTVCPVCLCICVVAVKLVAEGVVWHSVSDPKFSVVFERFNLEY